MGCVWVQLFIFAFDDNMFGMESRNLERYRRIQWIAKETIEYLKSYILKGVSEEDIANAATEFMCARGVSSFWYHGVGALVLVGDRTTLSISGRNYSPSDVRVKEYDLVTVDLSPEIDSYWGDFARSFVVANGRVESNSTGNSSKRVGVLFDGVDVEKALHQKLQDVVTPEMTFGELYLAMSKAIEDVGYMNLDFKGNLGHSIEKNIDDRIYICSGNKTKLSDIELFTFEPHIGKRKGTFGYKMEDIYYFSNGKLRLL